MKHTKTLLALLLAALLALGVGVPAMATSSLSSHLFTITGPEGPIHFGEAFTLTAEADVPDEIEILSYGWRFDTVSETGILMEHEIEGPVLHVTSDERYYPKAMHPFHIAVATYVCEVTYVEKDLDGNIETDADGNLVGKRIFAKSIRVTVEKERPLTIGDIWPIFIVGPLHGAFTSTAFFVALTVGLALPFSPIIFVYTWIAGIIDNIIGWRFF
ncbi:MAG: hypothetical protein FWE98_02830 [Oscillospiraceae bacterium]|nr:hypothetical protein [Oscillospiraceae bacterium]